ncbi:uncharacterized protein LOC128093325 [Culex pipiens pallens]|uniref:uncharacterized protein LOC128093325 n=1 Tax=Culex pipiens pallens TaxID=42434 RepID=UPI0022AA60C6|nr:uncharacterized protein LOC128093325 [Culex pipiens pallens]
METKEPQFTKVKSAQLKGWKREYPKSAIGPFAVFFRQQDSPINLITVADTINRYYSSVERISKENRHTVKVILTDREEANHLPQNPTFTPSYCVYVPCRYVEIDGIVDEPGLNPTELIKHGVGKFRNPRMDSVRIVRCNQLVKFSSDINEYLPTKGSRVTFAGTILPDFIEYKRVLIPVRLFIPKVMYCNKCHRYGHTVKFCRNPEQPPQQVCNNCKITHSRISDCTNFKAMALKQKKQYKEAYKKHLVVSTEQRNQTTVNLKPQHEATHSHSSTQQNLQQKCSRKVTPLFTLPQLVSLICDATGVEDNWREIINTAMPFWKHLWKYIVFKIPELDHLVTI